MLLLFHASFFKKVVRDACPSRAREADSPREGRSQPVAREAWTACVRDDDSDGEDSDARIMRATFADALLFERESLLALVKDLCVFF